MKKHSHHDAKKSKKIMPRKMSYLEQLRHERKEKKLIDKLEKMHHKY